MGWDWMGLDDREVVTMMDDDDGDDDDDDDVLQGDSTSNSKDLF